MHPTARFARLATTILVHLFLLVSLISMQNSVAQERVSIEALLSSAFPSNLTASPSGQSVAWVSNLRGARNIWMAAAPGFSGRQITQYSDDDGQTIGALSFTPDGKQIVYRRGDGSNSRGELPNPVSLAGGVEQAIHVVGVDGGESRKLADGSAPVISLDGLRIVYLKKAQVWSALLDGSEDPEALFEIRGRVNSLRWSPDKDVPSIAFVSNRGDHAYVVTYDLESRKLTFLDPTVDNDAQPVFSPDGRRIAFIRRPSEQEILPFMPRRSALPWSIQIADIETGKVREIWRAPEGTGSNFRSVSSANQLLWASGDRLIFPWEGDGWTHLYSIPASGGDASLLTPGDFEVQFVSLSSDRRQVLFSSNQDDIDRQHVWQVSAKGGVAEQITGGNGIEWSPVGVVEGGIVSLASDATTPAHPIYIEDGSRSRTVMQDTAPDGFPGDQLVVPEQVIFSAADGMQIHGQLFLPPGQKEGDVYPGVLFFHGGSRRQMLLGFHHRGYYHNAYAFNQYLASQGYVVMSVNYRSGIGYGMEFREAINYGARGASEYNDVIGAGLYLQGRDDVDSTRIGLWGGSYGGYLTALGLARASDLFAAGVDLHGVHDWNVVIKNFASGYDPATQADAAKLAYESSPMASIGTWKSPVLLIHGDDDRNVPFSETVTLVESLRRQEVEFEQLIFPDEVHSFLLHKNWLAAYTAAADFFGRKLK